MTTKFLDTDGRVMVHEIAEEMAYVEKPYREDKLSPWKKLVSSRTEEIIKGEALAVKHGEKLFAEIKKEEAEKLEEALTEELARQVEENGKKDEEKKKKLEELEKLEDIRRGNLVNNTILNSKENFKKFLLKLENMDLNSLGFSTTKNGEQEVYGKVDGIKVEIILKRHKIYEGSIGGERIYDYVWKYTGKLNGVYLGDEFCKMFLEKYREVQSKITGTRDALPSSEVKYIQMMNEGNFSLQYNNIHINGDAVKKDSDIFGITPDEVKEKNGKLYGTIGKEKVEITTYEVRGYTNNHPASMSDDISGRIDGMRISKKLAAMIRTRFHEQAAKVA